MENQSFWQKFKSSFKKQYLREDFATGLIVLGPIVLTIYIVLTVISIFGNIFAKVLVLLPFVSHIPPILKTLLGVVFGLLLIYLAGISVRLFFGFELEIFLKNLVSRIPLVNSIYNAIRELLLFITRSSEKKVGGKVALFRLTDDGPSMIGFVTQEKPLVVDGKGFYSVFMPTTPNPTTGFYFLVNEKDIQFLDMDFEEAFKIIMTAGIASSEEGGEILKHGLARLFKELNEKASGENLRS